jgi:hypothetical protein
MNPLFAASIGLLSIAFSASADAQSILVLNGTGTSYIQPSLAAAGFNVIGGLLDDGEIANALAADPTIVEIWIWNDGSFGNTGSPADPAYDFSPADLAALDVFRQSHPHWIMDGLSWRTDTYVDEQNLTMNEALNLAAAGGGIVLGADDASGDAIVQHVNQIAAHVGFDPFIGTYNITPAQQHEGGTIFASPSAVDPTLIPSTFSYSDVPHGLQPNGILLTTALFADAAAADPLYPPNPLLVSEVYGGTLYFDVDHLVTTSLPGGGVPSHSLLVLNGNGGGSLPGVLSAAGWNVVIGTLDPGQIASNLAATPSIEEIWVWSDGTYQAYDPSRYFDASDLAALDAFSAAHPQWIMDGLAWRSHSTPDEINLSVNEAAVLAAAGGGIVLGGDDDYDPFVLQHVNQVAAHAGFDVWYGVYLVGPSEAHATGLLVTTPSIVDPTGVNSTTSQPVVSHGLQPNGLMLSTALFCDSGVDYPGYTNPALPDQVFDGVLYLDVDALITTTIPNAGFRGSPVASFCSGDGSGTACPCGNSGNPGRGCENSLGTGGGLLSWSGTPSVSADDFEIDGSGMSTSGSVLYFQGTVATNTALGVTFGDGLRCVGGSVKRLGTRQNSGGASGYGAPLGDTPISVKGVIPASGGTFFYQAWYRNAGAFCTASSFNLTNGVAATWIP